MQGAALYLWLRALGLGVRVHEAPEHPDGFVIALAGSKSLEPLERQRVRRSVSEHKAELGQLLRGAPDRDVKAVLEEGLGPPRSYEPREAAS